MARVFLTNVRHREISIRSIEVGHFCSLLVITEKSYVRYSPQNDGQKDGLLVEFINRVY
jgi:hypothetical protein